MRATLALYAGTRFSRPIHRLVAGVQGNGCIPADHRSVVFHAPHDQPHRIGDQHPHHLPRPTPLGFLLQSRHDSPVQSSVSVLPSSM